MMINREWKYRVTTTLQVTPEELDYLAERLRSKPDAPVEIRELVKGIHHAARASRITLNPQVHWVARDAQDGQVTDIVSDTWIRSKAVGEFQYAQLHGLKGWVVFVLREPSLQAVMESGDFIVQLGESEAPLGY